MATICYSMAGEGRGHAVRVRVLVERLRAQHRFVLYASGDAYRFLAPLYAGSDVRVRELPGLHFGYSPAGRVSPVRTLLGGLAFVRALPEWVARLAQELRAERPALAITDFEPLLPRAAQRCGVPFLSLDHQHLLAVSDFTALPAWLQRHAALMGAVVRGFYRGQCATVVSAFHHPPLRGSCLHRQPPVKQIGVLLRDSILQARPAQRGHVMVYLRKFAPPRLLHALSRCGRPVIVYGAGMRPADGNLRFVQGGEAEFVGQLADCECLVTTAGNQLVGEALFLGKPVFALPESGNYEQYINAYCLQESGAGQRGDMATVCAAELRSFLARLDRHRSACDPRTLDGTPRALELIARALPQPAGQHGEPARAVFA